MGQFLDLMATATKQDWKIMNAIKSKNSTLEKTPEGVAGVQKGVLGEAPNQSTKW